MKALKYILGILVLLILAFFTLGMFNPELTYESRTQVNAPVEHAFAVFQDPDRMDEWLEGLKRIEMISEGGVKVGSKSLLVFEENGETMELTEVVTAFKENELYAFTLDADVMTANVEIRFVAKDSLNTEIIARTTSTGKNIMWRSILALAKSTFQQQDQDSYTRLKEVIESQQ